jgi:hypothetical protein
MTKRPLGDARASHRPSASLKFDHPRLVPQEPRGTGDRPHATTKQASTKDNTIADPKVNGHHRSVAHPSASEAQPSEVPRYERRSARKASSSSSLSQISAINSSASRTGRASWRRASSSSDNATTCPRSRRHRSEAATTKSSVPVRDAHEPPPYGEDKWDQPWRVQPAAVRRRREAVRLRPAGATRHRHGLEALVLQLDLGRCRDQLGSWPTGLGIVRYTASGVMPIDGQAGPSLMPRPSIKSKSWSMTSSIAPRLMPPDSRTIADGSTGSRPTRGS